ncbi:ATP-binding protein [Winogradskyella maritima]|uniref:histidine kinase n=1 Tax=Winogradskyella maritima TaxID=1517766 RepID=A0ABV8AE07_9FLAO|nr:ATP-binding protein [Winogradskyella maritima]
MNDRRYRYILYIIIVVIVATIGIQFYWNYKNYITNKEQLISDVQTSLDRSVNNYFTDLAEQTTLGFQLSESNHEDAFKEGGLLSQITSQIDRPDGSYNRLDSIKIDNIQDIKVFTGLKADSMNEAIHKEYKPIGFDSLKTELKKWKRFGDSSQTTIKDFEFLTKSIMIKVTNDTLNLKTVEDLLAKELERKNINIDFSLEYEKEESNRFKDDLIIVEAEERDLGALILSTYSESSMLPDNSAIKINFSNETKEILQRSSAGILISTLLVLAIISCLFYLLKIIKEQKQLAEIKNDLISNITHEFKTPIATIGVALESLNNFDALEDKTKTKNYLDMSAGQLSKLNLMVEKLLETATLDSEHLELNKEQSDVSALLSTMVNRYAVQFPDKTFNPTIADNTWLLNVDVFHFENALNNILDNAVKYGGDTINVDFTQNKHETTIVISDNGTNLKPENKQRIFEKFYRVPQGNTHNVKGFGIGLYYTKSIIEKHGGAINLRLKNNWTSFKINLPNV